MDSCNIWYCLCVILMLVCFCFGRFFCFFLWALGVTLFSLTEVAPRHRTQGIIEKTVSWRLSSTIWNFLLTAWYREMPGLTTNGISTHQYNLHSKNQQDDRWCARSTVHPRSKVWLPYTVETAMSIGWTLIYPGSKPEWVMSAVFSKKDSWIPCCLQQVTDSRDIKGYIYMHSVRIWPKRKL
jgi:hypothetical protein